MWQKSLGVVGCALAAFSCGGAPAPAPKSAAPVVAAPPAPAAPRTPSAEVARYWVFDKKTQLQLYAGMDSLMHTELFAGLVPGILEQLDDLKPKQKDCVQTLASQSRELLLGVDHRGGLVILELGTEGVKAARSACVGSLLPVERATLAGADEAYQVGRKEFVVVQPGVVLLGEKELIEAALAPHTVPVPATLSVKEPQQLVFQARASSPDVSATGALSVVPERFRFDADVDVPDEGLANMAEQKLKEGREQAKAFAQARPEIPLGGLLNALDVQRQGKHFKAAFELREPVVDQARDLGVLIGLSVSGVRRYLLDAKAAEAPNVMGGIALAYGATLKEPPAAGKKAAPKKLVSLPPVPASVPRGVKYQSSPDDWKAWSTIHFALTEPQYFQYEIVAAKDGKTAEIIARGDLDGNGKASLFRLKIQLDPKTGGISVVSHDEEEPLE